MDNIFIQFINEYGTTILYTILTAIAGYIGIALKNLYQKHINTDTKKDIVATVVEAVEQLYKDLSGEEKLNIALQNASAMLADKGISITDLELRMLIEASLAEFNDVFSRTSERPSPNDDTVIQGFSEESKKE